jgi:tetratricopeptide (TPR) repeat protein
VGYVNLGFQLLVGGGLITERGQDTIIGMMSRIIRGFVSFFQFFRGGTVAAFPLENDTTSRNGLGIFSASVLFLIITLTTAYVAIPFTAKWSHDQGVNALEAGDLESARQFLTLAIQLQPNTLPASVNPFAVNASPTLVQLGELYTEMGDFEQAQAMYERALREDTLNVIVHYQLADLYIRQGETERAILLLDQGVNLLVSHLDGRSQLPLGSDDEATQLLFLTYTKRGKAQLANDNPQVALQDLSDAIGLTRMNPILFIVPENMNNPPGRALLATEMFYLRGRAWSQLIDDTREDCPVRLVDAARRDWQAVQTLGSSGSNSQSRIWLAEASTELNAYDEACRGNND